MGRVGQLNSTVELLRKVVTKNEYGEYTEQWETRGLIRAYIHQKFGDKSISDDEVFNMMRIYLTIRRQHDIQEMDRIIIEDKLYEIEFIQNDDTKRWQTVRCFRLNE